MAIMNWEEEYRKCMESPYYFATHYIKIKTKSEIIDFTTTIPEIDFNEMFWQNKYAFSWSLTEANTIYFFRSPSEQIKIDVNHLETYLDIKSKILTAREKEALKDIFYIRQKGRGKRLRVTNKLEK